MDHMESRTWHMVSFKGLPMALEKVDVWFLLANLSKHLVTRHWGNIVPPRGFSHFWQLRSIPNHSKYIFWDCMFLAEFFFGGGLSKYTNGCVSCWGVTPDLTQAAPFILMLSTRIRSQPFGGFGKSAEHEPTELRGRPIQFTFQGIQQQIHLSEAIS